MSWGWTVNESVKLALGVLGNVTALGLFLSPVRTMVTVVRLRSTEDYSVFPYVTTLLNCLLWTFYGLPIVGEGRTLVLSINATGAGLEAIYVLLFFIFNTPKQRMKTSIYLGVVLVFLGAIVAIALAVFQTLDSRSLFVGVVAVVITVAMYASPLEISLLVIRTRSVKFMPFYLSLLATATSVVWSAYATYVQDIFVLIPNALGVLLGFGQLLLYFVYRRIETLASKHRTMSNCKVEDEESLQNQAMQAEANEHGKPDDSLRAAQQENQASEAMHEIKVVHV